MVRLKRLVIAPRRTAPISDFGTGATDLLSPWWLAPDILLSLTRAHRLRPKGDRHLRLGTRLGAASAAVFLGGIAPAQPLAQADHQRHRQAHDRRERPEGLDLGVLDFEGDPGQLDQRAQGIVGDDDDRNSPIGGRARDSEAMATGTDRPRVDLALKVTNPGLVPSIRAMLRSSQMIAAAMASLSAGSALSDPAVAARDRALEAADNAPRRRWIRQSSRLASARS